VEFSQEGRQDKNPTTKMTTPLTSRKSDTSLIRLGCQTTYVLKASIQRAIISIGIPRNGGYLRTFGAGRCRTDR
jgi:hypothetical protein